MGWRYWLRLPPTQQTLATEQNLSQRRQIPTLWELAAKGIYPAVRSRFATVGPEIESRRDEAFPPFVRRSLAADLSVVLLYDFGPRTTPVSEHTATVWGQSHEALWERALRNLRALPRPHWEDLGDGVFRIVSDYAYEETFPLLAEVMDSLPCKEPVIAIPNRGVMLATSSFDADAVWALIGRARNSLQKAPWPLSGTLLQRVAGGWSRYVPPPSLSPACARLNAISLARTRSPS
jgi:hypothetical protein